MNKEKQQAKHDIDVCKASLRAVIKQIASIKGAYQPALENRVLNNLRVALNQLDEIYSEDWIEYSNTLAYKRDAEELEK
tara:strand:- start:398 stop:634 length:237 start_codon:yes stop_codon:yes gene_type:complete